MVDRVLGQMGGRANAPAPSPNRVLGQELAGRQRYRAEIVTGRGIAQDMSSEDQKTDTREQDRDLGFGSVVADQARQRLLNRDGTFNVKRNGLGLRSQFSLYHALLTMSWPRFLGVCALHFFGINLGFAACYIAAGPGAILGEPAVDLAGRWWQAFFFAVETSSTVGYGHLFPGTYTAEWIMTIQALFGILTVALITGLVFARFSRPMADILFSRRGVIAPFGDGTAFMFRIANRRRNQLVNLSARVILALRDSQMTGRRSFHDLPLERSRVDFFPLHWTLVHPIDEKSPLYGITETQLGELEAEFLILLRGFDETFSQEVHTRSSYAAPEITWGAKFASVFEAPTEDEPITIDLSRLHDTKSVGTG